MTIPTVTLVNIDVLEYFSGTLKVNIDSKGSYMAGGAAFLHARTAQDVLATLPTDQHSVTPEPAPSTLLALLNL